MANVLQFRRIETIPPVGVDRLEAKKAPGVSSGDALVGESFAPGAVLGDCGPGLLAKNPRSIPFVFSVASMMVSLTDGDHHKAAFSPPPSTPAKCPEQDLNLHWANESGDERKTRQITGDFNISDGGGGEKNGAKKYFHNADFSVDDISAMGAPGGIVPLLGRFHEANRLTACERVCRANRRAVEAFMRSAETGRVEDVTAAAIEKYLAGLLEAGRSAKTIRNHKGSIGRFCQWAKRQGLLATNPAREVDPPPLEEQLPHSLTRTELAACLTLARQNGFVCEVAVAAYTGLRLSELRRLKWADVDLPGRTITVRKRKNRRPLVLGLHRFALRRMIRQRVRFPDSPYVFPGGRDRRDGRAGKGPWSRLGMRNLDTWCNMIKPLQDAVATFGLLPKGSVGRGWHLFRHTFATEAFRRGVDVRRIQKWMGHRCIAMTLRYTHVAEGYDAEIERL